MSYTLPEVSIPAVVSQAPFSISFSRDASVTDSWLRSNAGLPINESPVLIPFDSKIIFISATTNGPEVWEAEVYLDTDVRNGGIPTEANSIADLVIAASESESDAYNVNIPAGSELGVFCRGTGINRPNITIWLSRVI